MWAASQDGELADSANLHAFVSNGVWLIKSEASSSHRWIGNWRVATVGSMSSECPVNVAGTIVCAAGVASRVRSTYSLETKLVQLIDRHKKLETELLSKHLETLNSAWCQPFDPR